jgi:histidinol-phosphate aminotransferase
LICEPTFPMYRYWAEIAGAKVEVLRYSDAMEFPLDGVLRAMKRPPRVFFLANPNNPTGTLVPVAEIEKILKAAPRTVVVIDEAYVDFSGVSVVRLIRKYPQLFVARTFSKAAGLASLRLGAVIGAADSLALVRRAMAPFPVNLAALAACVAVVEEKKTMAKYVRDVKKLRGWFSSELKKRGAMVYPSAGNFVLADFGELGTRIFRALGERGILVRERSRDIGAGVARITIGTEKELKQLLAVVDGARRGAHA